MTSTIPQSPTSTPSNIGRRNALPPELEDLDPLSQPSAPLPHPPGKKPIVIRPQRAVPLNQKKASMPSCLIGTDQSLLLSTRSELEETQPSELDSLLVDLTPPPSPVSNARDATVRLHAVNDSTSMTPLLVDRHVPEEDATGIDGARSALPSPPVGTGQSSVRAGSRSRQSGGGNEGMRPADDQRTVHEPSGKVGERRPMVYCSTRRKEGRSRKKSRTNPSAGQLPIIKASDGKCRVEEAEWPDRSAYNQSGRLQWINCEMCHGRVHWSCASGQEENVKTGMRIWVPPLVTAARALGLRNSDRLWLLEEARQVWDEEGTLKVQRGWLPGEKVLEKPEDGYPE